MSFHRISLRAVWLETRGHVIIPRAAWVEPVLERGAPAAVAEHAAVPHALEGRDLVVARAPPGFERQIRIGADRNQKDVVLLLGARWRREAFGGCQLVVRVEWRRMTASAAFAVEDFLAAR